MNNQPHEKVGDAGHAGHLMTGQDSLNKKLTAKINELIKAGRIAPQTQSEHKMYVEAQQTTEPEEVEPSDGYLSDAEADADALASAGLGTDEDYGNPSELL